MRTDSSIGNQLMRLRKSTTPLPLADESCFSRSPCCYRLALTPACNTMTWTHNTLVWLHCTIYPKLMPSPSSAFTSMLVVLWFPFCISHCLWAGFLLSKSHFQGKSTMPVRGYVWLFLKKQKCLLHPVGHLWTAFWLLSRISVQQQCVASCSSCFDCSYAVSV